jgi:hypothetical protein
LQYRKIDWLGCGHCGSHGGDQRTQHCWAKASCFCQNRLNFIRISMFTRKRPWPAI